MYKILLIDDETTITNVLSYMLASENYEVNVSHSAKEGLAACLKEMPDLVLLDVMLPDGSGLDLCRTMKNTAAIKHIPVIILTGTALSVENKIEGLESGADDYIPKVSIGSELLVRVAGILKRSFNTAGQKTAGTGR